MRRLPGPMLRHSSRGAVAALWFLTACARQAPPPPLPRTPQDIFLAPQAQVIEAVVPPHATLDGLLRSYEFPTGMVEAAVRSAGSVFNLRQLRERQPYRLVRSLDGLLRSSSTRSTPIASCASSRRIATSPEVLDAEVLPYEKDTTVDAIRGTHRRRPSVAHRGDDGAGETIQLAMALADIFSGQIDFESDLQPGDSFEVLFEKSLTRRAVRRLRPDPRRAVHRRRPGAPGVPLDQSRDGPRRLLRRGRPIAEALLAAVAAEVRAAHHVRLLAQPPASGLPDLSRAPRRRLRGAGRRAGRRGRVGHGGVGGLGGRRRQPGAAPPRRRFRDLLPAPVGVRAGHPRRRARRSGAVDRPRRRDRHGDRPAPRLPPEAERRFVNPLVGAPLAAAGRADSRQR